MGLGLNLQVYRAGQMVGQQQFDSDVNRTIKIGRLPSAQVRLDDPKVSRIHAVIELVGSDVSLIDMGSTEGTAVNGAKVHKVKLNSGDQIAIGDTVLVVSAGAAAPAVGAAAAGAQQPMVAQPPTAPMQGAGRPMMAPMPMAAMPQASLQQPAAQQWAGQLAGAAVAAPQMAPVGPGMAAPVAGVPAAAPSGAPVQPRFDPGASTDVAPLRRITNQRLRSAAVESKPHPALAPEQQMTTENRVLELRIYWGEVLLGINHYVKPKRITIGETKRTNVFISSEGLPLEEFPLVRYLDDEYVLTFTKHMEGEFESGGQVTTLQDARGSSTAKRDDDLADSYQVRMAMETRAIVHWGGVTFALRFVPPSEGVPRGGVRNWDLQYLNVMVMSIFLHLATVITLMVYPYDTDSLREDLFDKPDRFANLILEPPKQTESNKNLLEKIKKQVEEKKEEIVKEKPPEKQLKVTTKVPPQVKPQKTQAQKQQEVKQRFQKLFSGSGAGGGSILGGGGGGTLAGTLSNVIGTTGAGSATAGLAGLGIRGSGPLTGGGIGTSKGIAGIGTSGRLGGGGLGYGSNVGLGKRRDRGVIDIGSPVVMGALPPEVIKKVIDENKNQIRYCYEIELQRNQNLEGKVAMKWIIAATGSVAKVMVKNSTMHNANVESCIAAKIKNWKFPAPAGGGIVEVNYPFIFKSS